ncbi:MAG: hypothetical protein IJ087_21495 [Eggerthellaceae bacterium]|nr:hypothetical protein [Eggerthellaceae bacterium]
MRGFARGAATTALNVCVTSPFTSAAVALLFTDVDDFANTYVTALAATMPMTMVASYLIIGPAVKLLFNNRISPAGGLQALRDLQQHAASLMRLFGM